MNFRHPTALARNLLKISSLALFLWTARPAACQTAIGATFGDVITLPGGTPSDIVLDESRHYLYLINNNTSQVYVFDYTTDTVVNQIQVGQTPLAGAISMDGQYLYVTCKGTSSLNVINLSSQSVTSQVVLPSAPQGVEVGADGRALISMAGTGIVSGVPQGTLELYDPSLQVGQQLVPVNVPALTTTPVTSPSIGTVTSTTFVSKLLRTPNGQYIVGSIEPTAGNAYVFVYEVASATVLRNRTFASTSTVLSMAPDGSRFMAGLAMFDINTLDIIAQQNIANAPFTFSSTFNTQSQIGGSIFSPDGSTLYSAFNVAATATPAPPPSSSTLLVNDPHNLGIHLGIKLPGNIVAKMVTLSDGSQAWGISDSGLIHLPLGNLYNYPILAPETTQVFLAMDDCNHGLAQATLHINNLGQGKLTFAVASGTSAAVEYSISSGVAPSTITFTMDPGRSGVTRYEGTNMYSGAGTTVSGTPVNITLSSAEAINIPNTIRLYMNYRHSGERGVIYPVPTTPNSNTGGITVAAGNEGLQDLVLDEPRGLLYITNSGYNRIEVFDTRNLVFLTPISVGQLPHRMAMTTDGSMLYVANAGAESISLVDLNLQQVVGNVVFPPIPRNGTAAVIFPRTIALGLNGLEFVMSDGSQWNVIEGVAVPRPANSVTPNALSTSNNVDNMIASPDNQYVFTLAGSGSAYVYSSTGDTYIAGKQLFGASGSTIQGYYGPLGVGPGGAYFLANGLIVNQSLTTIGGSATPSAGNTSGVQRNIGMVAPLTANTFLRMTTPIRASVTSTTVDDPRTTLEAFNVSTLSETSIGGAPENPVASVFGTARQNMPPRQMVADSAGTTAYAITLSGLSVIPLMATSQTTLPVITGISNATTGTQTIQPGSFITIQGQNLASNAIATTLPPPTVLGGSCVTFGNVSVPLLSAGPGQIQAQVPDTLLPGTQLVEVRSLATAQDSAPVTLTVRAATATSGTVAGPTRPVPLHPGTASNGSGQ